MNPFPIDELIQRKEYLEQYSFSSDEDFAAKLKSYYSESPLYRRTGRTYLMVRIMIELSIEHHRPINIVDHFNLYNDSVNQLGYIMGQIHDVLSYYTSNGINIRIIQRRAEEIQFELVDGHAFYNYFRINTVNPFKRKKEFSKKLLLII